jgi:hypothetical protein
MAGALSAAEFKKAAAKFPRLSDKAKTVAHALLVEGKTFEQITREHDASRQLAHQWATKIYSSFRPAGWVTETVTLPVELMAKVRQMESKARAQWESELPPPRITRR